MYIEYISETLWSHSLLITWCLVVQFTSEDPSSTVKPLPPKLAQINLLSTEAGLRCMQIQSYHLNLLWSLRTLWHDVTLKSFISSHMMSGQETLTERKKKAVDLHSRPALLRRPITASGGSLQHRERERMERMLRPHSAPLPVSAQVPLQYAPPKPTVLYNITHKCPRSKDVVCPKLATDIICSRSASRSRHGKKTLESGTPTQQNNGSIPILIITQRHNQHIHSC